MCVYPLATDSYHPPLWYSCLSSCSSWWRLLSTEVILLLSLASECFSPSAWRRLAWSRWVSNRSMRASSAFSWSDNLGNASVWKKKFEKATSNRKYKVTFCWKRGILLKFLFFKQMIEVKKKSSFFKQMILKWFLITLHKCVAMLFFCWDSNLLSECWEYDQTNQFSFRRKRWK